MTGYENLMRQHPDVVGIVRQEKDAWQAYVDHMTVRINRNLNVVANADDESRRLFGIWRALRNERDGIGNPRHKRNSIRFQPRSNGNARTA